VFDRAALPFLASLSVIAMTLTAFSSTAEAREYLPQQVLSGDRLAVDAAIDYDAIVGDIVQIFKWLEEPGMNDILLAARLRNDRCVSDCRFTLYFGNDTEDFYMPALASRKYIERLTFDMSEISPRGTRSVSDVTITFKEEYNQQILLSQLYQKSIGTTNVYSTRLSCPRMPTCFIRRNTIINLKNRHFPSSKCEFYILRIISSQASNYLLFLTISSPYMRRSLESIQTNSPSLLCRDLTL
jgi:hypothetical protein